MRLAYRHDELVVYSDRNYNGRPRRQYLAKVLYVSKRRVRVVFPVANDRVTAESREKSVSPSSLRTASATDIEQGNAHDGIVHRTLPYGRRRRKAAV